MQKITRALMISLFVCNTVYAKGEVFGVNINMGLHRPALNDLNYGEFKSPIGGFGTIINAQDEGVPNAIDFRNPLPELSLGVNAGLEFQWKLSEKYEFLLGGSTWAASSRAIAEGDFFLQGSATEVINERAAKLSYNEFYFGFRQNVIIKNGKYKIYYRLTLNEMFDIDLREDISFLFTTGEAEGVRKSIILQSQATGLIMAQPGLGVDFFFRDWLSMGVEASYVVGLKRAKLRDGTSNNNFLATDNLDLWLPQRISPDSGDLQYLSHDFQDEDDYVNMRLNFDGWKFLLRLGVYF